MSLPGMDFLFDVSQYPARWHCGHWLPYIGWTHITSDTMIFLAYIGIPVSILYYQNKLKAKALEFNYIFYLFASFIFFCGTTHLIEAIIFWKPIYNFAGLIKLITAIVSLGTLWVIVTKLPLTLRFINEQHESRALKLELESLKAEEAERALISAQEKNAKLTELDKLKSDFLANITHELRTPLTLIMGPLETILKDTSSIPSKLRENLRRMQRNSLRLYMLVNDVLDFSKLEAGKFTVHEEMIDLNKQVGQIVIDAQGLAAERKITLEFSECPDLTNLLLDRKMVDKVAINLISNALKFTPEKGKIKVLLQKNNDYAQLIVKDTGIGIPGSQMEHLFKRFHQVDTSNTRAYEGTGIGLALVNQFVHLLNGYVDVESQVGKGTIFTVNFPIKLVSGIKETSTLIHEREIPEHSVKPINTSLSLLTSEDGRERHLEQEREFNQTFGKRPLILIVDDNEDMRSYTSSLLEKNYEIITAKNGKEALEKIYQYKPQVVLSDVMMPIMDGLQLTQAIKADASIHHIPIILVTAKTGENAVLNCLHEAGADDYLSKPFSSQELLARTTVALRSFDAFNEIQSLQKKLQKEKEVIQSFMAEGLCVFDAQWRIVYLNKTAELFLQCIGNEVTGNYYTQVFHLYEGENSNKKNVDLTLLKESLTHGPNYNCERGLISTTTEITNPIAFSINPLPLNEKNEFNGAVLLFRDIRKQLEAELGLQTALKVSQKSNAAKMNFLANMSHEIRTPLNGVMGMLQLTLQTGLNKKQSEYVEKSYAAAGSLVKILGEILDYSKIEAGQVSFETLEFNLPKEIESIITMLKPECDKKELKIIFNFDKNVPEIVIGDPVRIKQIFNNLICNAAKFTPSGGNITVNIELKENKHDYVVLFCTVSDNGIGIPLEAQSIIFEMFSQADESTTRKYGGTGLGLAITKQLVELMGGTIDVNSREGNGATFSFSLKIGKIVPSGSEDKVIDSEENPHRKPPPQFNINVLIVEDNELNQTVILDMMKCYGCNQIDVVNSGESALTAIQTRKYDLILMDLQMPGMDGFTTTKKIRDLEKTNFDENKKSIIALTANALAGTEKRCLDAGIDAYMTKPVDFDNLTKTLQKNLTSPLRDPDGLS